MTRRCFPFTLLVAGIAGFGLLVNFVGCSKASDPWLKVEGGSLKVLVSFPPLFCFTRGVAGDDAAVLSLLAPTGPHDHQATADEAQIAAGADLFLVNGLQLDDFVANVAERSGNKKIKIVKVADKALPEKSGKRLPMSGVPHVHDDGTVCDHGEWDPHAWLGTEQAVLMVKEICESLKAADPAHASSYDRRAAEYTAKLEELQRFGKELLKDKKNRKVIATHDALAYFCKAFDLELVGSIMPRPGIEADAKKLAQLEELCKTQGIRIIAIEPQFNPKSAQSLQSALKAKGHELTIVEIDPLETAERAKLNPDYYFTVMRRNLENLAAKMQ